MRSGRGGRAAPTPHYVEKGLLGLRPMIGTNDLFDRLNAPDPGRGGRLG